MPPVPSSSSKPRDCFYVKPILPSCGSCQCCQECRDTNEAGNTKPASGQMRKTLPAVPPSGLGKSAFNPGVLRYNNVLQNNGSAASHNFGFGTNFTAWPYCCQHTDGTVEVMLGGEDGLWFDAVGGGYVARYGAKYSLTHDVGANQFIVRDDTTGHALAFNDFDQSAQPGGTLVSAVAPGSPPLTVVSYSPGGNVQETQRTYTDTTVVPNVTTVESVLFAYDSSSGMELCTSITLRRAVDGGPYGILQQARLNYFAAGDPNGNPGDLKYFTTYRAEGTTLQPLETECFRYHTGSGIPAGLIKYQLGPEATRRLLADPAGVTPETASDALWAKYADGHFTYDAEQRVVTSTLAAGTRTYAFAYTPSANTLAYNHWYLKTAVTRPDGIVHTIYTNHIQQVLLDQLSSPGWINYHLYDDLDAMELQHAHPSAVISYDETQPDLAVQLRASSGLIELSQYYASTSGGGVKNYLQSESVQQGTTGTPILQKTLEYARATQGLDQVTPVSKQTVYRDDAGTQPIVTSYAFTYYTGTVALQQMVTTLPVVSSGQNGDGVTYTRTQIFDQLGQPTWGKDELGFITYQAFDPVTGAISQSIQDVDMSRMVGVPGNPGWTTPASGGLHLVINSDADAYGRNTHSLKPWHDVDGTAARTASWTVYKDVEHEVWSAQGYVTQGTGCCQATATLVNPVSITRMDEDHRTIDTIVAVRANTAGGLSAADSFPQSTWIRWSKHIYNDAGDLVASRVYFKIPETGEGTINENYNETTFAYDVMGRRYRTRSAGGTITKNTFDPRSKVLQTLVGTDDSVVVLNAAFPWQNPVNPFDVNADGIINNLDFFIVAAKLGQNHHVPQLLPNPPVPPHVPPPYYDVNGDGWLTDADAQAVSTYLHTYGSGMAGGIPGPGGTVQSPGYNMVVVTANEYDGGVTGGDGNLTKITAFVDDSGANDRVTLYGYDFRNRRIFTDGEVDFYEEYTHDNLNQTIRADRKDTTSAGVLVGRNETKFDDRGRTYQTWRYDVDPSTGAVGNALVDNTFFDGASQVIEQRSASAPEAWTRKSYDGVGRNKRTMVGYTDGDGDKVFEQSEPTYDPASNVIAMVSLARFHDDTTTVGPLTANVNARPSYSAAWHDGVGRSIASAAYGTNGGAAFVRPSVAPASTETVLVSSISYNERGEAFELTDPLGVVSHADFDDAGRTLRAIQNYVPGSTASDANITVEMTYDADGHQATLTAVNASTGNQTTTNSYGVTLANSDLASNDLLREVQYPSDALDRVLYQYNRQGQRKAMVDQNGTVHAYGFDKLGRPLDDKVTALGSGVDGAVTRIASTYEVRGLVEKITSFNGAGGVANEVKNAYNGLTQLVTQAQSHAGAVGMGTPNVQYTYDTSAAGGIFTKGARPVSTTYPDGRVVNDNYGSAGGAGDKLARIAAIKDGSGNVHAAYSYLGMGAFVVADYQQPQVKLDYTAAASGDAKYPGFDRFGRVAQHHWLAYGASPGLRDGFDYGYDRNSNRLYRANLTAEALGKPFDELYVYDRVNRLIDFKRGTLNGQKTALTGTPTKAQTWGLDPTGNWPHFTSAADGAIEVDQTRVHNQANEITNLSAWFKTAYDDAGNMTRMPKPATPTEGFACTYDAWNRLVKVQNTDGCGCPAETVADYQYDGQTWRTVKHAYTGGSLTETRHFFYTVGWQCVEERLGAASTPERQHVWGLRYIDDLVLRDRDTNGDGTLDERLFSTQDANWNVVAVCDISGVIQERYVYTAYGVPSFLTAAFAPLETSSSAWEILFASYRYDEITRLYQVRYRFYDGKIGRFASRDPISYESSDPNLYRYAMGRPSIGLDAFGLLTMTQLATSACSTPCQIAVPASSWWRRRNYLRYLRCVENCVYSMTKQKKYDLWLKAETAAGLGWLAGLPDCPCCLTMNPDGSPSNPAPAKWSEPHPPSYGDQYHPGAKWEIRSIAPNAAGAGQQCTFDEKGILINCGWAAGTPDRALALSDTWLNRPAIVAEYLGDTGHYGNDVNPFNYAQGLDAVGEHGQKFNSFYFGPNVVKYLSLRPPNQGKKPSGTPCDKNCVP